MTAGSVKLTSIDLLILDIDNTLFDWFEFWSVSFHAMLDAVLAEGTIDRDRLLDEIRIVHQEHGTSEYAFLLQSVPCIAELPVGKRDSIIRAGREAFRKAREASERLYPDVKRTLEAIKACGTRLVAYTESQRYYTTRRLIRFGLDGLLDAVYCAEDHDIPEGTDLVKLRSESPEYYDLQKTIVVKLSRSLRKPNPSILQRIMVDFSSSPQHTAYVGDSLFKDVSMAQGAGVFDVFAAYGESRNRKGYDLLRRVSHWTDSHIASEKNTGDEVRPSVTLRGGFEEILEYFSFV